MFFTKWQPGKSYVFCNALPLTQKSFEQEAASPSRDFIAHYINTRRGLNQEHDWTSYSAELVNAYQRIKKGYTPFGFEFIDECSFENFKHVVGRRDIGTIILFSHCINNGTESETIEFFDRLVPSSEIAGVLTGDPPRIFDFSVCKCSYLAKTAKQLNPKNLYGSSSSNIKLAIWLYIFSETFRKIVTKKVSYLVAMDVAIQDAENRFKTKHQ